MTDRYYDTTAGEFIDFETLDDWKSRDAAKDARIEALESRLAKFEAMTMLDFANYLSAKYISKIKGITHDE